MSYRDLLFDQFGGAIIHIPCEDTANTWETRGGYVWNPTKLGTPHLTEGIFGGLGFKHGPAALIRALNASPITSGDRKESSGWFRLSDEYVGTGLARLWYGANNSSNSHQFHIRASGIRWLRGTSYISHERSLNDGQWHHWAVNGDGFWLDGELIFADTNLTYNAGNARTNRSFYIGLDSTSTNVNHPMREFLTHDEVAVYPAGGLTEAMIIEQANYSAQTDLELPVDIADAEATMLDAGAIGGSDNTFEASTAHATAEMGRAYVDLAGHATVLPDAMGATGELLTPEVAGHALVAVDASEGHAEALAGTVDAETNAVVLAAPAEAAVDMPGGAGEDNWFFAVDTTEMYKARSTSSFGGRTYEALDLKVGENVVVTHEDLFIKVPSRPGREIKQDSIEYTLHFYDLVDSYGNVYGAGPYGASGPGEPGGRVYRGHELLDSIPYPEDPRPRPRPVTLTVRPTDYSEVNLGSSRLGILFLQNYVMYESRSYGIKNPNVPGSGSFVTYLYKPAPIPVSPATAHGDMANPLVETDKFVNVQARPAKAFGEMLRGTAPHAYGDATVMDATAEMPMPLLSLSNTVVAPTMESTAYFHTPVVMFTREAVVGFPTVNVFADMPGGVYANVTIKAGVATTNAHMGAAWFRSDRVINAPAPENTLGEMINMKSVQADRNIIVTATAAVASAYIVAPLEVDETISDPYWMRVTRRATTGVNPPMIGTHSWIRFNQRTGDRIYYTDANGLPRRENNSGTDLGFDISGSYEWGAQAPNGKRGLRVHNASIAAGEGGLLTDSASMEFTFRIEPGHTGRMDIFNGRTRHTGQGGPWYTEIHASIRDGHLYMRGLKGGTSTMRLDDGQWHHVVMSGENGPGSGATGSHRTPVEVYIDGRLDRAFVTEENRNDEPFLLAGRISRPQNFFGQDTGYPFKGDVVDFVHRQSAMSSEQVAELYYDMFGYKPIRTGIVQVTADMYQDHRAVSGMKRMLMLSWRFRDLRNDDAQHPTHDDRAKRAFNHSVSLKPPVTWGGDRYDRPMLSEYFVYEGDEGEAETGRYLITHQMVNQVRPGDAVTEHKGIEASRGYTLFRNPITGRDRLIDIFNDIDLDDFDVIAFQAYPNPPMNNQRDRELYEPFLDSINRALVQGHKLWVTDPYLMADLGWIEGTEKVPVLGVFPPNRIPEIAGYHGYTGLAGGNDVRSYDIAPYDDRRYGMPKPAVRPANGAMPDMGKRDVYGYNLWRYDLHRNNGYRVVNEVEGLTDLPSWEVKEAAMRGRVTIFNNQDEWDQYAYMLENRYGQDHEWVAVTKDGDLHESVKPATGRGLRAGDEFYDWKWIDLGRSHYIYQNTAGPSPAVVGTRHRTARTWAIPPGMLRIGTPLTTFRSTLHNDFGNEVENPYRNYMRNFVIRPGDTLPGYGKVKGYAYADLAEQPAQNEFGGLGIQRHKIFPPGVVHGYARKGESGVILVPEAEDEETVKWDYSTWGRRTYGAGATVNITKTTAVTTTNPQGQVQVQYVQEVTGTLTTAQSRNSVFERENVHHMTWNGRGIAWLTSVDKTDAEYSNTLGETARATGAMVTPMVSVEFERTVHVDGVAEASADIVAPVEAQVREATVFARPATARGVMLNRITSIAPTPATGFADMPQNVVRPLDVEEVLFSSVAYNNEIIYLRLEEN